MCLDMSDEARDSSGSSDNDNADARGKHRGRGGGGRGRSRGRGRKNTRGRGRSRGTGRGRSKRRMTEDEEDSDVEEKRRKTKLDSSDKEDEDEDRVMDARDLSPEREKEMNLPATLSGPPEPLHQRQKLKWDYKVNMIGQKVVDPMLHCCEKCTLPILIYGRMIPCKHIFCYDCARKADKRCPRCDDPVQRIEPSGLGTVFVCMYGGPKHSSAGCRRTYLSERDLQAHYSHRHLRSQKDALNLLATVQHAQGSTHHTALSSHHPGEEVKRASVVHHEHKSSTEQVTGSRTHQLPAISEPAVHPLTVPVVAASSSYQIPVMANRNLITVPIQDHSQQQQHQQGHVREQYHYVVAQSTTFTSPVQPTVFTAASPVVPSYTSGAYSPGTYTVAYSAPPPPPRFAVPPPGYSGPLLPPPMVAPRPAPDTSIGSPPGMWSRPPPPITPATLSHTPNEQQMYRNYYQ